MPEMMEGARLRLMTYNIEGGAKISSPCLTT